jgi:hypothetical protein
MSLIGKIICTAGKPVDKDDGPAQPFGHQNGSDRKILVVIDSHRLGRQN